VKRLQSTPIAIRARPLAYLPKLIAAPMRRSREQTPAGCFKVRVYLLGKPLSGVDEEDDQNSDCNTRDNPNSKCSFKAQAEISKHGLVLVPSPSRGCLTRTLKARSARLTECSRRAYRLAS
jgi:hypothetical protein